MGLRDRLFGISGLSPAQTQDVPIEVGDIDPSGQRQSYQQFKLLIHRRLIEYIDEVAVSVTDSPMAREQVQAIVEKLLEEENPPFNQTERQQLVQDLLDETLGLGPLENLLRDPTLSDILVNRWDEVYVERSGKLERVEAAFRDEQHVRQIIDRIVSRAGRRLDESSPMVDARLTEGSRFNAIIPPLAVDGSALSIRRMRHEPLTMEDLLRNGSLNQQAVSLLKAAVQGKLNILVSGGTGCGKTTLLNILLRYIHPDERMVSIEDTVEIHSEGLHCVRLETRPPNVEGNGEISQRSLVKNVLRMRPDRILVGEVRGAEACDMIQAMNTGHKGCFTTIHANSPRDALARLETMILMAGVNLTSEAMRRQISSAIDLIIQVQRFHDGVRRITSISEVTGMEEQTVQLQELFKYQYVKEQGKAVIHHGEFIMTGVVPAFAEELQPSNGHAALPLHIFGITPNREG